MAHKLLGQDFLPHDVVAKVTGETKYAEDFRAEGMVFARLLSSPYPHARVRSIDATAALAMPGVVGILTPDDVKNPAAPDIPLLTLEPGYVGAPILLLAAEDETTAQDAIDKIRIDYEPLPFHVDPLASLHPDRPDARTDGNVGAAGVKFQTLKWKKEDFDNAGTRMPMGAAAQEWTYGELDATFQPNLNADIRLATMHGDVYTDFPFTLAKNPPPPPPPTSERGRNRHEIGRKSAATLGNGGVAIDCDTVNGDIRIRERS